MKNIFAYTIKKYLKQFEEELGSEDPWNFLFADIRLKKNTHLLMVMIAEKPPNFLLEEIVF